MSSTLSAALVTLHGRLLPTLDDVARVARLLEAAWWDGARTGAAAGFVAGVIAGAIVVALIVRAR